MISCEVDRERRATNGFPRYKEVECRKDLIIDIIPLWLECGGRFNLALLSLALGSVEILHL
jgi:hypothetical protein